MYELSNLIGDEAKKIRQQALLVRDVEDKANLESAVGLLEWEQHLLNSVRNDESMDSTERQSLIMARKGQGIFKQQVMKEESRCRITGVKRIEHLRASHIRPWRDCESAEQRLDGNNGLLLTPTIDHLFDRGYISFKNNGDLLISPVSDNHSLSRMGIDPQTQANVGRFSAQQGTYLEYHRDLVFLQARS